MKAGVDQAIINTCTVNNAVIVVYHIHDISASEVAEAIIRLKQSKREGSSEVMSDHLLFAYDSLNLYWALLFTMMQNGVAPNYMLIDTIVPIPKGRWANLCLSDNFRAITLSCMFGKILDNVKKLCPTNLQFSFKKGGSLWCKKRFLILQ